MIENTIKEAANTAFLLRQNLILSKELDSLKKSHRELMRKYNSLTIWKLLTGRHK